MAIHEHAIADEHDLPGAQARSFRFLLGTSGAEGVGDALTRVILPILAVSVLGLGSGFVGVLNAIGISAFLFLGVPIGMLIDNVRQRHHAMGAATLLRCLVLVSLVTAYAADLLSGALLLVAAVLVGVADVVFVTTQGTVIPMIVQRDGLRAAFSKLALTNQSASAAAAGAGSLALGLLGLSWALLLAALAYAGSWVLQRGIRLTPVAAPALAGDKPRIRGRIACGFTTLRRTPPLWALTLSASFTNAGAMLGNTILPVYVMRDLALPPASFAVLGAFAAAGAIAGAAAAPRLTGKFGLKAVRSGAALISALTVVLVIICTLLPGPVLLWLAVQSLGWSFLVSVSAVAGAEILPRLVEHSQLATVGSAQRTLTLGIMPITALLGGITGALIGLGPLLWAWMILAGLAAIPILRSNGFRDLP